MRAVRNDKGNIKNQNRIFFLGNIEKHANPKK